jgi:hypothetical protein
MLVLPAGRRRAAMQGGPTSDSNVCSSPGWPTAPTGAPVAPIVTEPGADARDQTEMGQTEMGRTEMGRTEMGQP